LGATTLGYSISDLLWGVKMGLSIFFNPSDKPEPLIQDIVKLAHVVRKEGILALEQQQSGITDPFLRMGIRYAIDGLEPTMTRELLETAILVQEETEEVGAKVFESAGGYAPTVGILQ